MGKAEAVYGFVNRNIEMLRQESSWSRGMLAKLRRGIGRSPGERPDIWEVTLNGLPDELLYRGNAERTNATAGEWAVHTALTLYALHQQGDEQPVSEGNKEVDGKTVYGNSLGAAARRLIKPDKTNEDAVKRRFDATITADGLAELAHHARGLIQLMKAAEVPIRLDYPRLAKDLYGYQFPDGKSRVRLRWGQDFYGGEHEEPVAAKN